MIRACLVKLRGIRGLYISKNHKTELNKNDFYEETDMADAYIIDAARTPRGIGKQGKGALTEFLCERLLVTSSHGIPTTVTPRTDRYSTE